MEKKNILLHICCAPDGCVPVPDLILEGWNVRGFFYGSNIHPLEEYSKRLEAVKILTRANNFPCGIANYNPREWLEGVKNLEHEPEGGERCKKCFALQLEAGAKIARALGCESFCTTLTISPHKNVELINSLGEEISRANNLHWEKRIWRKNNGFLRSVRTSKALGLYRQNYCGCVFSQRHLKGGSV